MVCIKQKKLFENYNGGNWQVLMKFRMKTLINRNPAMPGIFSTGRFFIFFRSVHPV